MSKTGQRRLACGLYAGALAAAAVALAAGTWAGVLVAAALACFGRAVGHRRGRVVAFNLGSVALVGAAATILLAPQPGKRVQTFSDGAFGVFMRDDAMGHRPAAGLDTRATLHVDGELVYDVTYTTDADALRVSPPIAAGEQRGCILFFGCSYTFGEGVEDHEAMPYVVGVKTHGAYQVRNFGYSGYGPHHMLAAIETGLVERAAHCTPTIAVYQAHPHHVLRASGKWWWDLYGPRYVMSPTGGIARQGSFADDPFESDRREERVDARVVPSERDDAEATAEDVELFHAIVQRSRDLLVARYPGIEFHVLHWDIGDPPIFAAAWHARGITVHPLSQVLPLRQRGWESALLLPRDVHPIASTHARIAEYVVAAILHGAPAVSNDASRER